MKNLKLKVTTVVLSLGLIAGVTMSFNGQAFAPTKCTLSTETCTEAEVELPDGSTVTVEVKGTPKKAEITQL